MNNLHRELAPITDAAWAQIDDEARRTFTRNVAGRRVVDVIGPAGPTLAAVGTGHRHTVESATEDVVVRQRESLPVLELCAAFTVTRQAVDDVERGAQDSDWQPVKDAARRIALEEDHTVFHGCPAAGIVGITPGSSNAPRPMPADADRVPDAVARALSTLRLVGVDGPYRLLLSARSYTAVAETADHGYPVLDHLTRLLPDGPAIWAPALDGGLLVSTRGGDYELHLGQDLSVGYLSHDSDHIRLYLQESLTFRSITAESSVLLPSAGT